MLILLPPSETKRPGGAGISIDKLAIIWAALDPARDQLIAALEKLCQDSEKAAKALKLGKNSRAEVAKNLAIMTSPTMPALHRYTGVLYQALDANSLSPKALKLAGERLFIQSALFGLLPALEQIPDYRFSASSKLPGINLIQVWTSAHEAVWPRMVGPILDMRSSEYQMLNPIPKEREQYQVEVFSEDGKMLNHFNKKSKGLFVRAALENDLTDISQVAQVGAQAGLRTEVEGRKLKLFAPR
jgi:cytoplasmic iron level regulating protein YaaA (DUF328/UPF0246 family)